MPEPIPTDSITTSKDARSKRPIKKRALDPAASQAASLTALFAKPAQEIRMPPSISSSGSSDDKAHAGTGTTSAPPEIVANVQGSSAGAGSGEFHVYKASRRREYERLRAMDDEVRAEAEAEAFERAREEREERDREKTRRNREKRDKMKARKEKAKNDGGAGAGAGGAAGLEEERVGKVQGGASNVKGPRMETGESGRGGEVEDDEAGRVDEATTQETGLVIHDDD